MSEEARERPPRRRAYTRTLRFVAGAALLVILLSFAVSIPEDAERAFLAMLCRRRVAAKCAPVDCLSSLRTRTTVHALGGARWRVITEARWGSERYEDDVTCAERDPTAP